MGSPAAWRAVRGRAPRTAPPAWHSNLVTIGQRGELGGKPVEVLGGALGLVGALLELRRPGVDVAHRHRDLIHPHALLMGRGSDLLGRVRRGPDRVGQAPNSLAGPPREPQPLVDDLR